MLVATAGTACHPSHLASAGVAELRDFDTSPHPLFCSKTIQTSTVATGRPTSPGCPLLYPRVLFWVCPPSATESEHHLRLVAVQGARHEKEVTGLPDCLTARLLDGLTPAMPSGSRTRQVKPCPLFLPTSGRCPPSGRLTFQRLHPMLSSAHPFNVGIGHGPPCRAGLCYPCFNVILRHWQSVLLVSGLECDPEL